MAGESMESVAGKVAELERCWKAWKKLYMWLETEYSPSLDPRGEVKEKMMQLIQE